MSTCRWCTPGGLSTLDFLKDYACKRLSCEDALSANDDLSYCLECVVEYHNARDDSPTLHKDLWELETSRLVTQFETSLKDESIENEELYLVDEYGEDKLPEFVGPDFEKNLRVPLLEILKYPYLLLGEKISELCVEALCKMERLSYSFQVFDKLPGIYLLLVHPNEMIRRWAILTARSLGKVDRDDYYDLQEVFTCLFKVIELGLFDSPDIYSCYAVEKGKLILLPPHLYDTSNYKNYWLGICMLLSVLEEQAMDSLLLAPDKQNDFMQSILHTMDRDCAGDGDDPFWPALHCFMVILDKLGAKVWGQLIDPIQAFQTIIDSRSYKNEIENIRNSTIRTKIEPDLDNCDDQVSCSQMVYNFNSEKNKKASGWKNAICPDYCPNMYEEMQTLTNLLQSDIGQDMRVHNSTFLWFIPFVQSVMDLKDLGVAYIVEVIHHLYSEIKDVLHKRVDYCDKVTEFFILILVSVIELHRNKKCLHLLWVSSQKWVEALVKCAKLPAKDFQRYSEKTSANCPRINSTSSSLLPMHSQATNSVQYSCAQLIRSLLKEGSQLGQQSSCKRFLDILNRLLRANLFVGLQLSERETQDLQVCLKQVIRSSKDRDSINAFVLTEPNFVDWTSPLTLSRIKSEDTDEWCRMKEYCQRNSPSPSSPSESRSAGLSPPTRSRHSSLVEESLFKGPFLCEETKCPLPQKESGVAIPSNVGAMSEQFHEAKGCVPSENPLKNTCDEHSIGNTSPLFAKTEADQQGSANASECVKLQSYELATSTDGISAANALLVPDQERKDSQKEKVAKPLSVSDPSPNLAKLKIANFSIVDLQSKLAKAMEKSSIFLKIPKQNIKLETKKDNIQSDFRSSFGEHAEDWKCNLTNVIDPEYFSPYIKQEPEERGVDSNIALTKPKDTSKSSANENDEGISLMQLTNATVEKSESAICSDNVKGCSLYEKLELLGDQQPSYALKDKHGKSIDTVVGVNLVKLHDRPFDSDGGSEETKDATRASESDSDDSIPLTQVRANLLNQRKCLTASKDTSEDSDVDSNVDKLSITSQTKNLESPLVSGASCIVFQPEDHIVRKVKGTFRSSLFANCSDGDLDKEIIVISDSTSEEEDSDEEDCVLTLTKPIKKEKPSQENEYSGVQHSRSPPITGNKEIKQEANVADQFSDICDEYDSQLFEFETEDEVYSDWQDSQIKHPSSVDTRDSAKNLVPKENSNNNLEELDWQEKCTEWGYDTDYISEDAIEEAAKAAEEKLDKELANRQSTEREMMGVEFHKPPAPQVHLALSAEKDKSQDSKAAESLLKNINSTTKPLVASKTSQGKGKASYENLDKKKSSNTETLSKRSDKWVPKGDQQRKKCRAGISPRLPVLPRTTPAVVPPKKHRKCPEPSSLVEKLGFRKPPRKAFDLSQRSLDSMTELRNHGKVAGALEIKQKQKTVFTCAQTLPLKGNRNLLACQDRQFYRQVRLQEVAKIKRVEELSKCSKSSNQPKTAVEVSSNKSILEHTASTAKSSKQKVEKTVSGKALVSGKEKHLHMTIKETPATDLSKSTKGVNIAASTTCDLAPPDCIVPKLKEPENLSITPSTASVCRDLSADNFSSFLSSSSSHDIQGSMQHKVHGEPSDDGDEMEVDHLFLTQPDPVDMEICWQSEIVGSIEMCTNHVKERLKVGVSDGGCSGVDTTSVALPPEDYKCKHSECIEVVKMPGLYCCNHLVAEISADHVFAIPNPPSFPKLGKPPTAKIFSSGAPSRSANLSKELENIPKAPSVLKSKSQGLRPTAPKMKPPLPTKDMILRHPSPCSVLQDLNNQSNVERGQPTRTAVGTSYSPTKQRDHNFLIQEILCWSYEMFIKFRQFGSPNNLSQFPCSNIPLSFSGYEEYFGIFFPLLMLNAFESMVQEWLENQRRKFWATYELQLQNFCTDNSMNRVDFQVWIRDADLVKQFHLKEDDLIFLQKAEDHNSGKAEKAQDHHFVNAEGSVEPIHYIGHIARFSRSQMNEMRNGEKYTACHLTVQTKGIFSGARNQLVSCEVIGGLVSTQRQFKALLQLRWSPLAKPIISPSPPEFMPKSQVNIATEFSYSKDYNENQRKAIETAYAMVKQHPALSRICLIHGPPGTGKSKTIVGLLYRILIETPANENRMQNTNAKNKRDRILVCAPSNAGVDELMKKIIIGFKDKSKDKNNFLGNCGDINLVRLGSEKAISSDVQKFSLDSQVSRKMNRDAFILDQDIQKKKQALDKRLDELSRQRAMERCDKQKRNQNLDQEIGRVARERQQIASQLKEVRKHLPEVQGKIILESDIICCTLNTSGSFLLESAFRRLGHDPFSCVIVDEAGQACEVETLIPLIHRCSKLILVGDPEQLPATVISTKAESYGYGQSMMARLRTRLDDVASKTPVIQLTVQYRMHPDICLFPSTYIYGKTLRTDRMTEEKRCSSDWPFQPYLLFDVTDGSEKRENDSSYANIQEVKLVIALVKLIKNKKKEIGFRNIGIITPYRAQKNMIMKELDKEFGKPYRPGEVDTVDGFQGRQKDCIIVTCVRANATNGSIGFLASRQRLNVTITRAKSSLFILGSMKTLMENKDWNELIQDAHRRGAIIRTQEKNYSKDVTKILKLKPALLRSSSFPRAEISKKPENSRLQHTPPRTKRKESTNVLDPSLLPQPPVQPAPRPVDSKIVSAMFSASVAPQSAVPVVTLPTVHERPRDPRLARSADSVVAVIQPRNSERTLLQVSEQKLQGQNAALLGNPSTVNLSWTQQASSSSATSRNTETSTSWHTKRDMVQSNWKGYPAHGQLGTYRDDHSGSKRRAEHLVQSEGAKKRNISSNNKPLNK